MILHFTIVFLELIGEVTHPDHLDTLHSLPRKVHYEPSDLCWMVLSDKISNYKLEIEAHYAILDRGYPLASLSLFYIAIILLYALC
jgi:hypothetical protein